MSDRKLTPELLLGAYAAGIFPMADSREDPTVYWVEPRLRGVIPLDQFHVSRSLAKTLKKSGYTFEINIDFESVIDACADRPETWINATIRRLMLDLHANGHAHSFEVRNTDGALMGGMYGLAIGGAFFGESMFSNVRDGSKVALTWAVDHLRRAGVSLFDTQFVTDHLISLGAVEIPRLQYLAILNDVIEQNSDIAGTPIEMDRHALVQRMTQTS